MYPYVVADIGGTNARFALVVDCKEGQYQFDHIQILKGKDYKRFDDALAAYLESLGSIKPYAACAAIAGPINGDSVKMTNLDWSFSCTELSKSFGLSRFIAMNDFGAVACAAGKITTNNLVNIKSGDALPYANQAVFGPGTGLGVAGIVNDNGRSIPLSSEGGHTTLAPSNALEADVIKAALPKLGHVSAESFISGPGLINLYQALAKVRDESAESIKPAELTAAALSGENALCTETLSLFCRFAGSFAGNLALTYGAKGGVFIAGGVVPRFADFVRSSEFIDAFCAKGVMSKYVQNIPVNIIVHPEVAFIGAAVWLEQVLNS